MDQAIRMRTAKEEGLAEGLEKGRTRGLAEGLEKGRTRGLAEGMEQGMKRGMEKALHREWNVVAAKNGWNWREN